MRHRSEVEQAGERADVGEMRGWNMRCDSCGADDTRHVQQLRVVLVRRVERGEDEGITELVRGDELAQELDMGVLLCLQLSAIEVLRT
jgi:hypothetical protein